MSPQDIRAAAETHRELGPEYGNAVVESFIDRVGREIDARVDQRVAASAAQVPVKPASNKALALAIVSLAIGIPLTAIIAATHEGLAALAVVWLAIAVINVGYTLGNRPPRPRR